MASQATYTSSGSPNTYHKVSIQLTDGSSAEEVRQALLQWLGWQADNASGLVSLNSIQSQGGYHHTYAQTVLGIPVFEHEIKANVTNSFRLLSVTHTLDGGVPAPQGSFDLTAADMAVRMGSLYGSQRGYALLLTQVWWATESALLPAWRAEVRGSEQWLEIVTDAQSGAVLRQRELSSYHNHGTDADTNGTAFVFNPDPLTTAGVLYGGAYVDNNDADNAELNAQRQLVTLRDITFDGTTYSLQGPHVFLEDINNPPGAPATSTNGEFLFTRSQQGFEDAMCYYHIDTFQRYVQWLGFTNLYNSPLHVDPHGMSGTDNSRFSWSGVYPYLEFGEGGVDDDEDADVIIHEYGHALSYSGSPGTNSGFERNGLDEGIGDYFATSYSKSLRTYRWDDMFTWDGHNPFWPGRDGSIATTYPPGGSDFYVHGAIWNSTLMQVQNEIGRFAMDKIQLQELFMNSISMTLPDAARLCYDADTMLYGGWYTPNLQKYFCMRGILTGSECIVSTDDAQFEDLRWQVYPNPATSELNVSLSGIEGSGAFTLTFLDVQGREIKTVSLDAGISTLSLDGLGSGMYFVRLERDGVNEGVKKVVVW
jgi:hypothetical protein